MLTIDRFQHVQTGESLRGFFVKNRQGKIVATGADGAFLAIRHKRYLRDADLVRAVERMTGLTARR